MDLCKAFGSRVVYYATLLGLLIGCGAGTLTRSAYGILACAVIGGIVGLRFDLRRRQPDELPYDDVPKYADELNAAPVTPKAAEPPPPPKLDPPRARSAFANALSRLFVAVARADGDLLRDEVRVVKRFFDEELRYSAAELDEVRLALKAAAHAPPSPVEAAREARAFLTPAERSLLLNALFEMALVDGPLARTESDALKVAARELEVAADDVKAIRAMHLGLGLQYFEVLGVPAEASDEELKASYRRLAALHHPDRVAHLGPGAAERASRRFQDIQRAWEEVRRLRGL